MLVWDDRDLATRPAGVPGLRRLRSGRLRPLEGPRGPPRRDLRARLPAPALRQGGAAGDGPLAVHLVLQPRRLGLALRASGADPLTGRRRRPGARPAARGPPRPLRLRARAARPRRPPIDAGPAGQAARPAGDRQRQVQPRRPGRRRVRGAGGPDRPRPRGPGPAVAEHAGGPGRAGAGRSGRAGGRRGDARRLPLLPGGHRRAAGRPRPRRRPDRPGARLGRPRDARPPAPLARPRGPGRDPGRAARLDPPRRRSPAREPRPGRRGPGRADGRPTGPPGTSERRPAGLRWPRGRARRSGCGCSRPWAGRRSCRRRSRPRGRSGRRR